MQNKIKKLGQIHTPSHIVADILNLVEYEGDRILKKHIIDNSCGNGAFLTAIVEKYIVTYRAKYDFLDGVEKELEKYVHGIEIDVEEYLSCIDNLNGILLKYGLKTVKWDVINTDTLEVSLYDGEMDYVVANPPYVRIHNMRERSEKVRNYKFAQSGMTDLFIVFYEIGFKMLNKHGKLVYITPNSFYSSVAGQEFRRYIVESKHLCQLVDLGHYQPFKSTTYTTICAFDMSDEFTSFDYSIYSADGKIKFQERLVTEDAFNNGKMILANKQAQDILKEIQNYVPRDKDKIQVKNAFATLADDIYIKDKFDFSANEIIDVIKASTGIWKKCVFPYTKKCKVIEFDQLTKQTQDYLMQNKARLETRSIDKNSPWYAFGRNQAIKDINKNKIAINNTVKDISSIKINYVKAGQGVYSGLYILTDTPFETVKNIIRSNDFIEYVRTIGKCKSGGYFTFSSGDLRQYLYFNTEARTNE